LIGLRAPRPELFTGVPWSDEATLRETLRIAGEIGMAHELLEPLSDVDEPEDLEVWERARGKV
jgi:glycosyltransferase A (GT-A) superfamily protein (DUF2064 family)